MDAYIMNICTLQHMYTTSTCSAPQTGITFYMCVFKLRIFTGSMTMSGNSAVKMQVKFANTYLVRVIYQNFEIFLNQVCMHICFV